MADEDKESKTEEPSHKRLEDARKKGDVPNSREVTNFAAIGLALAAFATLAPTAAQQLTTALAQVFAQTHAIPTDPEGLRGFLFALLGQTALVLAPALLLLVLAPVLSGLVQRTIIATAANLAFKLERISPIAGFKRIFSVRSLVEFGKGLLKIGIVGGTGFSVLYRDFEDAEVVADMTLHDVLRLLHAETLKVIGAMAAVVLAIAGFDYFYQRLSYMKRMRMSREELKEEFKQTEGHPEIKSRIRRVQMSIAKRRMMQKVPTADVVITNPTHFAVALSYSAQQGGAPVVVAKGADAVAARIREIAGKHNVPIVRQPPLARALHELPLDAEIPPELYRAVADVIAYVMSLKEAR